MGRGRGKGHLTAPSQAPRTWEGEYVVWISARGYQSAQQEGKTSSLIPPSDGTRATSFLSETIHGAPDFLSFNWGGGGSMLLEQPLEDSDTNRHQWRSPWELGGDSEGLFLI